MLNFFLKKYIHEHVILYKIQDDDFFKELPFKKKNFLKTYYLKNISIFIKFKKNYKYFSYINYNDINYKYISCTKRHMDIILKKYKVVKTKLTFEEFLDKVFLGYFNLKIKKKTFLIFSNFLIFFFKSFESFFKKKLLKNKKPEFILFKFKKFFYKFKKIKSCKKNLQKRITKSFRKKENFLY